MKRTYSYNPGIKETFLNYDHFYDNLNKLLR